MNISFLICKVGVIIPQGVGWELGDRAGCIWDLCPVCVIGCVWGGFILKSTDLSSNRSRDLAGTQGVESGCPSPGQSRLAKPSSSLTSCWPRDLGHTEGSQGGMGWWSPSQGPGSVLGTSYPWTILTLRIITEEEVLSSHFIQQQSQASERNGHPKAGPTAGRGQEAQTHIWL